MKLYTVISCVAGMFYLLSPDVAASAQSSGLGSNPHPSEVFCYLGKSKFSTGVRLRLGRIDYSCNPSGQWQPYSPNENLGACVRNNRIYTENSATVIARIANGRILVQKCKEGAWTDPEIFPKKVDDNR